MFPRTAPHTLCREGDTKSASWRSDHGAGRRWGTTSRIGRAVGPSSSSHLARAGPQAGTDTDTVECKKKGNRKHQRLWPLQSWLAVRPSGIMECCVRVRVRVSAPSSSSVVLCCVICRLDSVRRVDQGRVAPSLIRRKLHREPQFGRYESSVWWCKDGMVGSWDGGMAEIRSDGTSVAQEGKTLGKSQISEGDRRKRPCHRMMHLAPLLFSASTPAGKTSKQRGTEACEAQQQTGIQGTKHH